MNEKNIWVVIAAYNEEKMIAKVLAGVLPYVPNIVVVDDCSRDKTSKVAEAAGAHVVRHPINRGQGAALQTGMDFAYRHGADIVVHFDADGQHQANEIESVIAPILSGDVDVVLGSRFLGSVENIAAVRRIVLRLGILFTWFLSGIRLTDTHNGFRALSRSAVERIRITEDRFEHASEILHEISRQGIKYREVPVTIHYTDYSLSRANQGSLDSIKIATRMIVSKLLR